MVDAGLSDVTSTSIDAAVEADANAGFEAGVLTGVAYVRVAHVSASDAPVDACLSAAGGDFSKSQPLLAARSTAGVSYGAVTAYQAVASGAGTLRFVAPGAIDCLQPLSAHADSPFMLASQSYSTIVVAGFAVDAGVTPLDATIFADDGIDSAIGDGGNASSLRIVHEAPRIGALDVGSGSLRDGDYQAMFPLVPYGGTSPASATIDANGYLFPATISGTRLSAHLDGQMQDVAIWENLNVDVSQLATFFIVAGTSVADGGGPTVRGLFCARDYAQPAHGVINPTCAILP